MVVNFDKQRQDLVNELFGKVIKSENVKNAFLSVKREFFVREDLIEYAYFDDALPIGFGQTISQPTTIAIMLELLDVEDGMRVLEVGVGCGYVCALLSFLVGPKGKVYGTEIIKELKDIAENNLKKHKIENVELYAKDGSLGLVEKAPFDRIIISAACPYFPKPLVDQLKDKGKIVAPIGDKYSQQLEVLTKSNGKIVKVKYPGLFVFVPLRGEFGFK
ncbi:MAG: protein-L-isoaspartate(D-aspartate) O-methyltransferase [Candidatus Diapherotrites archaeon]|nr:protein-L-isoaspartate(D-aspartate) O-methyltransferase [Candidatus Diapherotrites archaeon]